MKNDHELEETVSEDRWEFRFDCAWATLFDIADAGVTRGETLLYIATKLLEAHPDEERGPAVAQLAAALKGLRADVERMRAYDLGADDVTAH